MNCLLYSHTNDSDHGRTILYNGSTYYGRGISFLLTGADRHRPSWSKKGLNLLTVAISIVSALEIAPANPLRHASATIHNGEDVWKGWDYSSRLCIRNRGKSPKEVMRQMFLPHGSILYAGPENGQILVHRICQKMAHAGISDRRGVSTRPL